MKFFPGKYFFNNPKKAQRKATSNRCEGEMCNVYETSCFCFCIRSFLVALFRIFFKILTHTNHDNFFSEIMFTHRWWDAFLMQTVKPMYDVTSKGLEVSLKMCFQNFKYHHFWMPPLLPLTSCFVYGYFCKYFKFAHTYVLLVFSWRYIGLIRSSFFPTAFFFAFVLLLDSFFFAF